MTTIGVFAAVFDEAGQVLCVHHAYGERIWSLPGGRLEAGEDPLSALERELLEETSMTIEVTGLVGVYSAPYRDDLVLLFAASLRERGAWCANDEIAEIGFFPLDALPESISENTRVRLRDVAEGRHSVVRTFAAPGVTRQACGLVETRGGSPDVTRS